MEGQEGQGAEAAGRDFSTLSERIRYGLEKSGITPLQLAKAAGVKNSVVENWLIGNNQSIKTNEAIEASFALGVNFMWLLTGRGGIEDRDRNDGLIALPYAEEDFLTFPVCRLEPQEDGADEVVPDRDAPPFCMHKGAMGGVDPTACIAFLMGDDSMEPRLLRTDTVLVRPCGGEPLRDHRTYAFIHAHRLLIRTILRPIAGGVVVRAANPDYPDEAIDERRLLGEIRVIGEVIARCGPVA
ncbi:MAG: LexA family transcriptional regulator [Succinivibrionaceae bacterium]|nr:LexA family transcriptional regulator [Succinivibrionaceae bacterium]